MTRGEPVTRRVVSSIFPAAMGKKSGSSVQKRQRELKRAEKAQLKRDRREQQIAESETRDNVHIATEEDLAGYGFPDEDEPVEGA